MTLSDLQTLFAACPHKDNPQEPIVMRIETLHAQRIWLCETIIQTQRQHISNLIDQAELPLQKDLLDDSANSNGSMDRSGYYKQG